jgi:hypothetical protein
LDLTESWFRTSTKTVPKLSTDVPQYFELRCVLKCI